MKSVHTINIRHAFGVSDQMTWDNYLHSFFSGNFEMRNSMRAICICYLKKLLAVCFDVLSYETIVNSNRNKNPCEYNWEIVWIKQMNEDYSIFDLNVFPCSALEARCIREAHSVLLRNHHDAFWISFSEFPIFSPLQHCNYPWSWSCISNEFVVGRNRNENFPTLSYYSVRTE